MEALPEEVPERDERRPKAVVETAVSAANQRPRLTERLSEKTGEESQQLSAGNARADTVRRGKRIHLAGIYTLLEFVQALYSITYKES
jgi:hypothetical protein